MRHSVKAGWILTGLLACLSTCLAERVGPPFQTDDPDPVDFHHFEAYAFELSDGTGPHAGGTVLEVPGYEMNWGAVPNVQLHLVTPMTSNFSPNGGGAFFGYGDTELGAKVRFLKETKTVPEVGIFPFFELPTGSPAKGLGVGKTWYRMPLWVQKSWGPWTSYGGGGEAIVPQDGYKDYPFAGLLVQRQLNKKLTLGSELYGHGAEGEAATSTRASTMLDMGGIYEFREGFDLLFAAGRSVYGQPETYTYCALYWTWGPKSDEDKAGGADAKAILARMHLRR